MKTLVGQSLSDPIKRFWDEFVTHHGSDPVERFYEVFHFDDNENSANELGALVLAGTKQATASLLWVYEFESKLLPRPGILSVVTNWSGDPLCVIESTQIDIVPFNEVSEEFAAIEGEGDKSLRHWLEAHTSYFGRECERIGRPATPDMPVVCEQFRVVYGPK